MVRSGLGGRPNAAGYPQLDACIMDGPGHRAGCVAGLEGIVHPIRAARQVMEGTRHVMLVGEGARWFALDNQLESANIDDLPATKQAWVAWARRRVERTPAATTPSRCCCSIVTATSLVVVRPAALAASCWAGRRLADPGAGLYVDDEVGAAGATGIGENVMRCCSGYQIVEFMRQGMTPQQACEEQVHRIARVDPRGYQLDICFLALDKHGRFGAAASNGRFPFAVGRDGERDDHDQTADAALSGGRRRHILSAPTATAAVDARMTLLNLAA